MMALASMPKGQPLVVKCGIGAIQASVFLSVGTDVSRTWKSLPVIFGSALRHVESDADHPGAAVASNHGPDLSLYDLVAWEGDG